MTLVFLVVVFYLYVVLNDNKAPMRAEDYEDIGHGKAEGNKACVWPPMEFMPKEFQSYFKPPPPIHCAEKNNPVTVNNGRVTVTDEAKKRYKLQCTMTPLIRVSDFMSTLDKTKQTKIQYSLSTGCDFFKVACYTDMYKRPEYASIHSTISILPQLDYQVPFPAGGLGMNVLMIGFDSVSRLTWMRNMPKTHEWFTNNMGGVVLEGYNIVGDGTPQALFPILVGKSELELPELRRGFTGAKPLDDLPWIWKQYQEAGYATQWAEDGAEYGTFQYRMLGFKQPPVHHYMRPFYIYAEEQYSQHQPFCLGDTTRHMNMLNWGKQFYQVYAQRPRFSFLFHSELSHDKINLLQLVDDDLLAFLQGLQTDGLLDNTMLILMSDHGVRYQSTSDGLLRNSLQGKYEERLPYMGILLPESVRSKHPDIYDNLRINKNRLTTPFDIHATLEHVLHYDSSVVQQTPDVSTTQGVSLFQEIPDSRTCPQAGIAAHWCVCMRWTELDTADDSLQAVMWALMRHINEITRDFRDSCEELRIAEPIRAEMFAPESSLLRYLGSKDRDGRIPDFAGEALAQEVLYQITIRTAPNDGLYEATIKHDLRENRFKIEESVISRLNAYGNDPACVMSEYPHLRPYCYCKNTQT